MSEKIIIKFDAKYARQNIQNCRNKLEHIKDKLIHIFSATISNVIQIGSDKGESTYIYKWDERNCISIDPNDNKNFNLMCWNDYHNKLMPEVAFKPFMRIDKTYSRELIPKEYSYLAIIEYLWNDLYNIFDDYTLKIIPEKCELHIRLSSF